MLLNLVNLQPVVKAHQICCVSLNSAQIPGNCLEKDTIVWPIKNLPKSCKGLWFMNRSYRLKENLVISSVQNFSIIGNNSTLDCSSDEPSLLVVNKSKWIRIENIKFISCGHAVTTQGSSTILLNTLSFVFIINTVFKNSCGYGITRIDMVGETYIVNIIMSCSNRTNFCQSLNGGIIMTNTNNKRVATNSTIM